MVITSPKHSKSNPHDYESISLIGCQKVSGQWRRGKPELKHGLQEKKISPKDNGSIG